MNIDRQLSGSIIFIYLALLNERSLSFWCPQYPFGLVPEILQNPSEKTHCRQKNSVFLEKNQQLVVETILSRKLYYMWRSNLFAVHSIPFHLSPKFFRTPFSSKCLLEENGVLLWNVSSSPMGNHVIDFRVCSFDFFSE